VHFCAFSPISITVLKLRLHKRWPVDHPWLNWFLNPAPSPSSQLRKIPPGLPLCTQLHLAEKSLIIIQNGSDFNGMVTQDSQHFFKLLLLPKEQSWKIIAFCSFLKNFQRSKKVTNIYRFTSGLLSTTDLFQIQTSTEASNGTHLKHRLFFHCQGHGCATYAYACVHAAYEATFPGSGVKIYLWRW
jgi:hypothetical protein